MDAAAGAKLVKAESLEGSFDGGEMDSPSVSDSSGSGRSENEVLPVAPSVTSPTMAASTNYFP